MKNLSKIALCLLAVSGLVSASIANAQIFNSALNSNLSGNINSSLDLSSDVTATNTSTGSDALIELNINATNDENVEIYFEDETNSDINFRVNSNGIRITSAAQVESEEDLEVFKSNMALKQSTVAEIETRSSESKVTVIHKHNGRLFGLIPVTVTSVTTVEAKADGETEVHARKSWYSFLVTNESYSSSNIETRIENNPTIQANATSNLSAQAKAVIAEAIIEEVAAQSDSRVSA
jgi:hypothetical protein